jgi:DNA-directed RNA polymerase subunit M/transcription elongation factor TFIIS
MAVNPIVRSRELFSRILRESIPTYKLQDRTIEKLSIAIEKSCYNSTIENAQKNNVIKNWNNSGFLNLYQIIIRRVAENIDTTSNIPGNTLAIRIFDTVNIMEIHKLLTKISQTANKICKTIKTVNIKLIGFMDSYQLNPVACKGEKEIVRMRGRQRIHIKVSNMYTCSKCTGKESRVVRQQTRSGDEGYTYKIICVICGHEMTKNG